MRFNIRFVSIASLVALIFSAQSMANCPDPKQVTFQCANTPSGKHCQWTAPWYEGYQDPKATASDQVTFVRAFWATSNSNPTYLGSTICFYLTSHDSLIFLTQNNWGNVSYPTEGVWHRGEWQGVIGRECVSKNPSECKFNYPT